MPGVLAITPGASSITPVSMLVDNDRIGPLWGPPKATCYAGGDDCSINQEEQA